MPSPKRRAGPRHDRVLVPAGELAVHGVAAAADLRAVHDVVVHERERVHELERGRGVDHAPGRRASPPAPTNAQAQNAGAAACRRWRRSRAARRADRRARGRPRSSASARRRAACRCGVSTRSATGSSASGKRRGPRRRRGHAERLRRGPEPTRHRSPCGLRCRRVAEFLSDEWIAALARARGGEPGAGRARRRPARDRAGRARRARPG